ncbi:C40 family peptidase [Mycobacterium aquaticum]|uniref:C40 family peptidase n=1 Tax=Mycobacterium aquaticum TaxID=1927124 RepID=UPI001FE65FEB|nr:NlpC/P60 family protein [Mycobacterium aquaticum]
MSALDAATNTAATDGRSAGEQGRGGASGVRDTARTQASAIAPAASSPAGARLMVSTMDERLAAMQQQIDTTKAQNKLLAARLRQVAQAYRATTMSGGGRGMMPGMSMPSFGGGGGGMPGMGGGMPTGLNALSALTRLGGNGQRGMSGVEQQVNGLFGQSGAPDGAAARAIEFAKAQLGKPYALGANGPNAWDCSSLVQKAYAHAGVSLERTTYEQIREGQHVSRGDIRPGDLILQNFSAPGVPEHVALAVSPTMQIEAPKPGGHVQYSPIPNGPIVVKRVA